VEIDFATRMRANFERKAFSCDKADSHLAGKNAQPPLADRSSAASRHRRLSEAVG
jgi:hypothetical protein